MPAFSHKTYAQEVSLFPYLRHRGSCRHSCLDRPPEEDVIPTPTGVLRLNPVARGPDLTGGWAHLTLLEPCHPLESSSRGRIIAARVARD